MSAKQNKTHTLSLSAGGGRPSEANAIYQSEAPLVPVVLSSSHPSFGLFIRKKENKEEENKQSKGVAMISFFQKSRVPLSLFFIGRAARAP